MTAVLVVTMTTMMMTVMINGDTLTWLLSSQISGMVL
jgi:hypothetical protein